MNITVKNLGIIKNAKFSTNKLTVICGHNNTGKTYLSYALYGFLEFQQSYRYTPNLTDPIIQKFRENKQINIDTGQLLEYYDNYLTTICNNYSKHQLYEVFDTNESNMINSYIHINIPKKDKKFISQKQIGKSFYFVSRNDHWLISSSSKSKNNITLSFEGIITKERFNECKSLSDDIDKDYKLDDKESEVLLRNLYNHVFDTISSDSFILTAERSGTFLLRNDNARKHKKNSLLKEKLFEDLVKLSKTESSNIQQIRQDKQGTTIFFDDEKTMNIDNFLSSYPKPIQDNLDFAFNLADSHKMSASPFAKKNPNILRYFERLASGSYKTNEMGHITFHSTEKKDLIIPVDEASSSIKSLLYLFYYLKYHSEKGDYLFIDEPELNLHPEKQRMVSRLLAMIANAGIKVVITTHSDYIIREFNSLILLYGKKAELRKSSVRDKSRDDLMKFDDFCKEFGYDFSEELNPNNINIYTCNPNNEKNALETVTVDKHYGIALESFDSVIRNMNRMQEHLLYGDFD